MRPPRAHLPPPVVVLGGALGLVLSATLGAYVLGQVHPPAAAALGPEGCAPTLAPAETPGALVVADAGGAPRTLDAVEARWWDANGSLTPWRTLAAHLAGAEGVVFTDADGSRTLTAGDLFRAAAPGPAPRAAGFRCA